MNFLDFDFSDKILYLENLELDEKKAYFQLIKHVDNIRAFTECFGEINGLFTVKQDFKVNGMPYLSIVLNMLYLEKSILLAEEQDDVVIVKVNTKLEKEDYPTIDELIDELKIAIKKDYFGKYITDMENARISSKCWVFYKRWKESLT